MLKSRVITLPTKVHIVKAMAFSVVMYGYDIWTIYKTEHWRTDAFEIMVLEKTPHSPLDCKEIKLVNCKGNQAWILIGRTVAEAEVKSQLIRKAPDSGKDWEQEEKEMTED